MGNVGGVGSDGTAVHCSAWRVRARDSQCGAASLTAHD